MMTIEILVGVLIAIVALVIVLASWLPSRPEPLATTWAMPPRSSWAHHLLDAESQLRRARRADSPEQSIACIAGCEAHLRAAKARLKTQIEGPAKPPAASATWTSQ